MQGHGLRERQVWGPPEPDGSPALRVVRVRRYRCIRCRAVSTVAPAEVLTKRLYSASAIAWSLALFGLAMLSPAAVRQLVSPMRVVGDTSAARWLTLLRWCRAVRDETLFRCARRVQSADVRAVAEAAAATVASYALPSPEPPPLPVLAFFGAARAG